MDEIELQTMATSGVVELVDGRTLVVINPADAQMLNKWFRQLEGRTVRLVISPDEPEEG